MDAQLSDLAVVGDWMRGWCKQLVDAHHDEPHFSDLSQTSQMGLHSASGFESKQVVNPSLAFEDDFDPQGPRNLPKAPVTRSTRVQNSLFEGSFNEPFVRL